MQAKSKLVYPHIENVRADEERQRAHGEQGNGIVSRSHQYGVFRPAYMAAIEDGGQEE